jgi:hypothetical protein
MEDKFLFCEVRYEEIKDKFISAWCSAFERGIPVEIFDWLFGSESGNRIFIAQCKDTSSIAGGYCLLPQQITMAGKLEPSFLCNNVFTTPNFRTFNIFVKLGRFALKQVSQDGRLALGIPNKLAIPGHKRVGWHTLENIKFIELDIRTSNLDKDLDVQDIDTLDLHSIAKLSERCNRNSPFSVVKTQSYLNWRYFKRPEINRTYYRKKIFADGEIAGYIILSHYHPTNRLHIIDVCATSKSILAQLFELSRSLGRQIEATCVNTWASPYLLESLPDKIFFNTNESSNFIVKDLQATKNVSSEILDSLINHSLVLGDNDVF